MNLQKASPREEAKRSSSFNLPVRKTSPRLATGPTIHRSSTSSLAALGTHPKGPKLFAKQSSLPSDMTGTEVTNQPPTVPDSAVVDRAQVHGAKVIRPEGQGQLHLADEADDQGGCILS